MSNNDYEDDDFDFEDTSSQSNPNNDLVKQLRKAGKQKDKELQELREKFDGLSKAQRDRTIKDVLETRGINKKISAFIPTDIDPTEESLSKWLDEYGDVFGIQSQESNQNVVDPQTAAAYKKMNNATENGLTPDSGEDIYRKLMSATSKEELDEVIRQSGL
jgi:hypothetical protein